MGLSFRSYTSLNLVFWFSLFHLTLSHFVASRPPLCHHDELSALLQFKESLTVNKSQHVSEYPSAYPKVSSWKAGGENDDCCSWDGITCNEDTGHVVRLNLTSSYLYGSINSSSSLFHLVHLEWLSLADNNFNDSEIPSRIMSLSRLSHLDLSYSGFSSSIPHTLANLSSLTYLSLEYCELQGEFPTEIFRLPNLHYLSVSGNPNLIIYLPEFEKNSPLEKLFLAGTRVSGGIPNSLGNLKSLSYMDLSGCNFTGKLQVNSSSLAYLYLDSCELHGEFPSEIFRLPNLHILSVSRNPDLTICLPEFEKNSSLEELRLEWTQVVGRIPNSLGNLKSLSYLDISNSDLSGPIPSSIVNLTHISNLYLSGDEISG